MNQLKSGRCRCVVWVLAICPYFSGGWLPIDREAAVDAEALSKSDHAAARKATPPEFLCFMCSTLMSISDIFNIYVVYQ